MQNANAGKCLVMMIRLWSMKTILVLAALLLYGCTAQDQAAFLQGLGGGPPAVAYQNQLFFQDAMLHSQERQNQLSYQNSGD